MSGDNGMTKSFYNEVYRANHPSQYDGGEAGMPERMAMFTKETSAWLALTGLASMNTAAILEIGCGMAFLSKIHPGWHGAEYSKSAVARIRERDGHGARIFEEDAQNLSFQDGSFDGVFTWATLEHIPDPNKAFGEIDRVLRGGGYGLIAPAWNCRSWTVKKLVERTWRHLNWVERLERVTIPVRELLLVRALFALPKRLGGELKLSFSGKPMPLRFRALYPRWKLIEKYGHVSDDDAVVDIDPHAGICFFKSRGYEVISHPSILSRLKARYEPLIIRKPSD
jgi:SAM-dependent methyltransferase